MVIVVIACGLSLVVAGGGPGWLAVTMAAEPLNRADAALVGRGGGDEMPPVSLRNNLWSTQDIKTKQGGSS